MPMIPMKKFDFKFLIEEEAEDENLSGYLNLLHKGGKAAVAWRGICISMLVF